jgi:hypothetical protein
MNRRSFFSSLAAFAATATLDPERLLWRPGAKMISIPKLTRYNRFEFECGVDFGWEPPHILIFDWMAAQLAEAIDAEILWRYEAEKDWSMVSGVIWTDTISASEFEKRYPRKTSA